MICLVVLSDTFFCFWFWFLFFSSLHLCTSLHCVSDRIAMDSTPASGAHGYGYGGVATPGSAMNDEGPGAASSAASASLQLLAVRHQARLELRAALHQLTQRGLVYASKW